MTDPERHHAASHTVTDTVTHGAGNHSTETLTHGDGTASGQLTHTHSVTPRKTVSPLWVLTIPAALLLAMLANTTMSRQSLELASRGLDWTTVTAYGPQTYQMDVRMINRYCLEDALKFPQHTRVRNVVIEVPVSRGAISRQTVVQMDKITAASYEPVPALDSHSTINFGKAWGSCPATISAVAPGSGTNRSPQSVSPQENARPQIPAAPGR